MPGLSIGATGYAGGLAAVPMPASQAGSVSITQKGFGIGTSQTAGGPATAGYGCTALGIAGAVLLAWLWWTLPR